MIENFDKSSEYTQKLFKIDDDIILEIELESLKDKVPIITREVLNFMLFEAERIKAKNILEIGTATGFSGIFLAQIANRNSGKLTTIEIDEVRYEKAKENFKKLGLLEKNEMILGDALDEILKLDKDIKYIEDNNAFNNENTSENMDINRNLYNYEKIGQSKKIKL